MRGLVFPFAAGHVPPEGRPWTGDDLDNWRVRVFRPAATAVGRPATLRPRDLRNSLASLLIWEDETVVKIGQILGHAPTVRLDTYAGRFEEYSPTDRKPAADAIRAARATPVKASKKAVQ